MITPIPLQNTATSSFLLLSNPNKTRKCTKPRHSLPRSRHLHLLRHQRNPNFKVTRGMRSDYLETEEPEDSELPVELSYTRTLSPALTLEHGFVKIGEELQKLKLNPPSSKSGILRFQVAVPPSAKSLNWFCSQPQSLGVFPQFYLSENNLDHPPPDLGSFDDVPGVSGIGASVCFTGTSESRECSAIQRYLSVDSPLIRAYGFIGISFDTESATIKHGSASYYLFIPQIELDQYEGISLLAATLAWDDYSIGTFDKAIHSIEITLYQARKQICHNKCILSVLQKSDLVVDDNIQMVFIPVDQPLMLRLSSTIAVTHKKLDYPGGKMSCRLQHSSNINALWASLIVEECSRLGLTYFCIAPGSRSSPLAIAASAHPRTTCISCFDERSLAFHAVGYARGSYRPAVVITSSGTAVSNLLPAVVEACQDFVPLLLLTADRPPELLDAGANQAINQVNHFGSFVRFFFSLPTPTDHVPARMVLTTVDSAVYRATHAPNGPVHINCHFREPLDDSPSEWMLSCLKGLDRWMSREEPFTKYFGLEHSQMCNNTERQFDDVLDIIQSANKGLLLIGAIHTEDEMWAALLLAKHLSWPTVADILSGLRFKKLLTSLPRFAEKTIFIDHLDHAILSDSVKDWAQPDVVIQIGSRITSKRISQMLEACSPCSYIMVDKHPYRHDPSHIVTHRIQCTITEFADLLFKLQLPRLSCKWTEFMQAVNSMVAREIEFQIHSEHSLTEPHVAQVLSEALPSDAALFIGNSMAIRDADMYGRGWMNLTTDFTSIMSGWKLSCLGLRASGNRGASGIDGLLSTAIGFAVGSYKQVFCVIGDISFLYDTNGLAILKQRVWRKPLTILVINNHGGGIFSLLPIAEKTEPSVMNRYFYTSHNTSIGKLCEAHSVNHLHVRTKVDLRRALSTSQRVHADCIIEVESCIEDNAIFHSTLKRSARQAADNTLNTFSRSLASNHASSNFRFSKIYKVEYSLYRIQLSARPTSATCISGDLSRIYKEGFIVSIYLEDGSVGFGEVAPLENRNESLQEVEEQLRFLIHVMQEVTLSSLLPLLRGSFSFWIWECLGILPHSIFPSVRCGMEMAVLNALAARQGCSLAKLLHHEYSISKTQLLQEEKKMEIASKVQICALLDSNGVPEEMAQSAAKLVEEGFNTIKIKVGRRANPSEDAAVIQEIRRKVGYQVKLRADANRSWTYEQAFQFASAVQLGNLQYIEEPVNSDGDIIKFCDETGLPVALDETVDSIQGDLIDRLARFIHPGIVAVVIKPSVVGGFENAALIAEWAQQHNKMAVVSSAFESSLSLSAYIQFSYYLEQQNQDISRVKNKEPGEPIVHGLGTYRWLREDITTESLRICGHPHNEVVEASIEDAAQLLLNFKINPKVIKRSYIGEQVHKYQMEVDYEDFCCSLEVLEVGKNKDNTVVFLHGFLGTGEDWMPIMKALSASVRCISIDLPGHGRSLIQSQTNKESKQEPSISIEVIANILSKMIHNITPNRVVLVGYSMGGRIALYMALHCSNQVNGAVIISGSPGLKDVKLRRKRRVQDDVRAESLRAQGLHFFLESWYSGEFWRSFKDHPNFAKIISSRMQHKDVQAIANVLSDLSVGRQRSLWGDLKQSKKPLLFLHGENDKKFKEINKQMFDEVSHGRGDGDEQSQYIHDMIEIPNCGHAVHLENPLSVINAISKFLRKLDEDNP